jgi:CheY-like chemotaxis protein
MVNLMSKILLIDDEPDIRITTGKILEKRGYEVVMARDGEEGLKILKNNKVDLILLDVMMPGPDGWEVCREIKGDRELRDIPVVMFTVMASEEDMEKSRMSGADAHISKPFSTEELVETIEELLPIH